jgi:Zn-dependent M28 family amino/carboxypeptidase
MRKLMIKNILLAGTAFALAACGAADKPVETDRPSAPTAPEAAAPVELLMPLPTDTTAAIRAEDVAIRIKTLADDTFEGRGPGTPVGEAAAEWIAQEMARIGLQPGGDNGSYFQKVGMVNQTIDEDQSSLTFSMEGVEETEEMTLKEDAVIWTKRQNANHIEFDNSEVIFVGYGIVAPEYDWNDYEGLDATGKTVVMLVNDPGFATGDPDLFNGEAMTYYGRWTYKYEEAARQGATAAIIVHETAPASYGWDVVSNSWSGAQSDLVRADGGTERTMLEGWLSNEASGHLFDAAGLDMQEMQTAAKTKGFTPVDMGKISVSGKIHQTIDSLESRNVIGVLEGETTPDEYMMYTAHWDHLGKKSGEKTGAAGEDFYEDDIFNGAVDNATGVAALLEIGEAMAAEGTDRSVMFLSVTLEESGLLGSAYYAENPTVPHSKVVAGINMDGALPIGRTKEMVVVGYGASELEDHLKDVIKTQDRVIKADPTPEAGYFYRSDHISLAKKGVPMLYADGGQDKRDGGDAAGRAAAATYTAQRYHKPMDEYSDDWDLSGFVEDIQALYTVGLGIADSDDWPTWYEGNEFEAARKASLASGN